MPDEVGGPVEGDETVEAVARLAREAYERGFRDGQDQVREEERQRAALVVFSVLGDALKAAGLRVQASAPTVASVLQGHAAMMHEFSGEPKVLGHLPVHKAAGVELDQAISVYFAGQMDPDSLSVRVAPAHGGHAVQARTHWDPQTRCVSVSPEAGLSPGVGYRVMVEGARSQGGVVMKPYSFEFTTRAEG